MSQYVGSAHPVNICVSVAVMVAWRVGQVAGGDKSSVPCKFGTRCNKITCPFAHPERYATAKPSELGAFLWARDPAAASKCGFVVLSTFRTC
jgi:hypothetical protein